MQQESALNAKKRRNFRLDDDSFVLVNSRGTVYGRGQADRLFQKLCHFCGLDETGEYYTVYSIRIGVTSTAHLQDIEGLKAMRYVQWVVSAAAMPMMHSHDVKYTTPQLATVPWEVIHIVARGS